MKCTFRVFFLLITSLCNISFLVFKFLDIFNSKYHYELLLISLWSTILSSLYLLIVTIIESFEIEIISWYKLLISIGLKYIFSFSASTSVTYWIYILISKKHFQDGYSMYFAIYSYFILIVFLVAEIATNKNTQYIKKRFYKDLFISIGILAIYSLLFILLCKYDENFTNEFLFFKDKFFYNYIGYFIVFIIFHMNSYGFYYLLCKSYNKIEISYEVLLNNEFDINLNTVQIKKIDYEYLDESIKKEEKVQII